MGIFSSNYSENKISLFGVEGEIETILLAYALHGNKNKVVRQLNALKATNHSNPKAIKLIEKTMERFNKINKFRFLW